MLVLDGGQGWVGKGACVLCTGWGLLTVNMFFDTSCRFRCSYFFCINMLTGDTDHAVIIKILYTCKIKW